MAKNLSLIAVTAVQRCVKKGKFAPNDKTPPTPPVIETLAPGTHFVAKSQEEYDWLVSSGAAVPNEEAAPKKKGRKKAAQKQQEPEPAAAEDAEEDAAGGDEESASADAEEADEEVI